MATDYSNIDQPYNNYLERSEFSTDNGNVENQPVRSDGAMSDVWIKNFIRSENWKPKTTGFYINGQTGYAEFSNVYVSGNIQALTGAIGGFLIGANYIEDVADSFGLSSEGTLGTSVRLWAGSTFDNRATAPFRVLADGTIAGSSITVSAINLPDTTTTQSFHVQNNGNSWWGANLAAGYGAAPAYVLSDGSARFTQVAITGSSTIGGTRLATTIGSAINVSGNFINDVINPSLDTAASYIKSNFTFTPSGAIVMASNANNGLWLSPNGIYGKSAGAITFSVDNLGNATFKGSIQAGTTIAAGISITAPHIIGGDIKIGTDPNIFVADANGIYLGSATFGFAPFRVDMQGQVTASKVTITGSTTSITLTQAAAGGGGTTTSAFRWAGGSKIWSDTNNYMGYNAIGGYHYFYSANTEAVVFPGAGQQAWFNNGISCRGPFNVGQTTPAIPQNARFTGNVYYNPTSNSSAYISGGTVSATFFPDPTNNYTNSMLYTTSQAHVFNVGATNVCKMTTGGLTISGYFYSPAYAYMYLAGYKITATSSVTLKNAIVPTSKGYKALNCIESPDVWFMDFCEEKGKLDPLFEETTTGPYRYIKCEDGGYQVWGKRKHAEHFRFQDKTKEEFEANERFLNLNKPGAFRTSA